MIISMIQMRLQTAMFRYGTTANLSWNLGCLLLDFFDFYGRAFNYFHTGLSILNDGSYFPKRKKEGTEWVQPTRYGLHDYRI